eukprot:3580240-Ditylum_brightwellii.AAC.1
MLALTTYKSELLKLGTAPIMKQAMYYKIAQWCNMPTCSAPELLTTRLMRQYAELSKINTALVGTAL